VNWLVSAALFASAIIALLMRRIGRDAGGRADTRYFQRVGWVFSAGLLLLPVGLLAGLPPRHPFILMVGMGSAYLSVYLLALFAYSFPRNERAPLALRLSLGALTAALVLITTRPSFVARGGTLLMSASMVPYFALTMFFVRRNWKAATAPDSHTPSLPVTLVQLAVVSPWLASFVAFTALAPHLPQPMPTWIYLLQALCMAMVVVGGVAIAILRYHLFEIRVLIGEAVLAVAATGAFALFVGVAAEPLHASLSASLSPGFAALVIAGVPPLLVHAAMSLLDRWTDDARLARGAVAAERALLDQTLSATARMVDPDAVLEVVMGAMREATGGEVRFLRGSTKVVQGEHAPAPTSLQASAAERPHAFWSVEHRPELPEDLGAWMDAEDAALVVPVRRDESLYGFLVVRGAPRVPRAAAMLCARLGEHLALKLQNFALYADAALAARELADYRAFLENLVESLPVGVAAVGPDMRVVSWNHALERQSGISRARAMGADYFNDLFPQFKLDPGALDTITAMQRDPSSVVTRPAVEVLGPQGVRYQDILVATFRDRHGSPSGVVVITDDVTDRVRLAQELEESRRLASLGAFAAAIAHDIRTPLTSIQMNVQILRSRAELRDSDREYLDIAQDEIARLTRSVGEILEYARPLTLDLAQEDLGELIDDLARSVSTLYAERSVEVRVARDPDDACVTAVDATRLRKALLNLLDNAVDATEPGGAVTLRLTADSGSVTLAVEDRGRGIAPENLARVFDPFFTTRPDGTGLGLAIARKVVRAHEGTLEVESDAARGTRFTLTLPRDRRVRSLPSMPPVMYPDPFRASGVRPGIGPALVSNDNAPA
jgi:PAS domain S-box-containing protein